MGIVAGLAACGVAIFSEQLGLGADVARGMFGWKRITLLVAGALVAALGAMMVVRPGVAARFFDEEQGDDPLDRRIRIAATLVLAAGVAAAVTAILAEDLGLGAEAARGMFGWKRIALLAVGVLAAALGATLSARPQVVSRRVGWRWIRREFGSPPDMRAALRSWRLPLTVSGAAAIVAFIPRAMTAGHFQNIDEFTWMGRSESFATALLELDFAAASATTEGTATMPGVTTMWLGAIARGAWGLTRALGIADDAGSFNSSALGIHLSQLSVGAATSVLIGVLVLLAWRWAGPIAAIVAGVLLATEPLLVSNGAVVHTDELAGLFAVAGAVALLLALGVPDRGTSRPRTVAALAGVLLAGALLSKLSALLLAPGLVAIVGWALVRNAAAARTQGARILDAVVPVAAVIGIVFVAGLVTTLLAWPAIWADPVNQLNLVRESAGLASEGHRQFFRGEVTSTPIPLLYVVSTPFRMTPWFLIGTLTLIAALATRGTRSRVVILAVIATPAFVALSLASHQFTRYVVLVLPFLALSVGIGIAATLNHLWQGRPIGQVARAGAGAVIALALAHSMWVAPSGTAYFNPLLGGSRAAERTILIGGNQGQALAGERIEQRQAPDCDIEIAVFPHPIWSAYPCGSAHGTDHPDPDYVVIDISGRQRSPETAAALRASGPTVDVVTIRGIVHAEIIETRDQSSVPPTDAGD